MAAAGSAKRAFPQNYLAWHNIRNRINKWKQKYLLVRWDFELMLKLKTLIIRLRHSSVKTYDWHFFCVNLVYLKIFWRLEVKVALRKNI